MHRVLDFDYGGGVVRDHYGEIGLLYLSHDTYHGQAIDLDAYDDHDLPLLGL